jgi:diphthamide synthase (EF-2-diphthine--ammonia ligase)
MLTRQQIIDTFVNGINETPGDELIEVYQTFTQEQLDAVIARNIAARSDATYAQRVAEDYQRYMAATDEERVSWKQIEPQ